MSTSGPTTLVLDGSPLPLVGPARIYACGITPYDVTHLGHASTFVWTDTLARVLEYQGIEVQICRNITDVDDVLVAAAERAGAPYDTFAAVQQFWFDRDMAALQVRPPAHEPRAHRYVPQVVRLAAALLDAGAAYLAGGNVYLPGAVVAERAGLERARAESLVAQNGGNLADPHKQDPLDAPLWLASAGGQPAWDSPWGSGRPGWHVECTVMAVATFGASIDIHAGGADLAFPHHAFAAAAAEALTGVTPFARRGMRVGTVAVDGAKMAKSTGNLVLVSDLLERYPAAAIRLLLLKRPWAAPWQYDETELRQSAGLLEQVYSAAGRPGAGASAVAEVQHALLDDLDVPRALSVALDAGGPAARMLSGVLGLG